MKIATIIVRILLGLMFFVFGLSVFLNLMPTPKLEGLPAEFMHVMFTSRYIYAVKVFEVAGGLLLLIGRFVPLGLTLLGPVIVNILFYDIFIGHSGLGMGVVVAILALFLLWSYRAAFAGLVKP